jgi:hypothetical protein
MEVKPAVLQAVPAFTAAIDGTTGIVSDRESIDVNAISLLFI